MVHSLGLYWYFWSQYWTEAHICFTNAWIRCGLRCNWKVFLTCRLNEPPHPSLFCQSNCWNVLFRIPAHPQCRQHEKDSLWKFKPRVSRLSWKPWLHPLDMEELSSSFGWTVQRQREASNCGPWSGGHSRYPILACVFWDTWITQWPQCPQLVTTFWVRGP